MRGSSDFDKFVAEETNSEEKRQLVIENSRLQHSNEQLKNDLNKLQNQFDELLNSCPQINELSRVDGLLTKEVSDLNIKNVELNRRLEISLQTNNDLSEKLISLQSAADSSYNHQITKINTQMRLMENQHKEEIEKFEKAYQKSQNSLKEKEKELLLLKNQISKVLNLSQNYFKSEINDCNTLCSILMNPKENSITKSSSSNQNTDIDPNELEKKLEHYKSMFKTEKLKKKQVELTFLQYQKDNECKDLIINQLKNELEDLKRTHENTIKQIELAHKQELLVLTTSSSPQIKYKSMITQTTPESFSPDNQINQSHNSSNSTLENISDPSSISSINQINNFNNINGSNSAIIEQMKTQNDSLFSQLKKAHEKYNKLKSKNQIIITKMAKSEKENKTYEKRLLKAANLLHQLQDENENLHKKLKENIEALNEQSQETETKSSEMKNMKRSIKILEKLTGSQKADIVSITKERDRLLSLVLVQNQALESFEKAIENMKISERLKSRSPERIFANEEEEGNENNLSISFEKSVNWDFGTLPQSIVSILKNFTENEGFSIDSKIHHVFSALSKWFNNLTVSHNNEKIELQEKIEESVSKYDGLISDIANSLGLQNPSQEEVLQRVSELNSEHAILTQKANEFESLQKEYSEQMNCFSDENDQNEPKKNFVLNVGKLQEKLKELNTKCKLRKIELKECKAAFLECQKRSEDEIDTLRQSNEKARKEINELQKSLTDQHQKYKDLQEELAKAHELHLEEYNRSQEDFENILMQNSSNFDDFQNKTNADIIKKNNRISALQNQLDESRAELNKSEQTVRFLTEEVDSLKGQLASQTKESERRFEALEKQRLDGLSELENHFNKVHETLIQKNKMLANQIHELNEPRIDEQIEKDNRINSLEEKVSQLEFQLEQETSRFQSAKDALERQNKLLLIQNNAKVIALETNYSMKCDQLRKELELNKKELIGFIANQFRSFYDVKLDLNEDTIKNIVKKIRYEVGKLKKRDEAIRKILNVKDGEQTEDALTELIMSMYPQLNEQTPKSKSPK